MERIDLSVLEYILRIKRLEIANSEAISQARLLEKELEEWNAQLEGEREEEKNSEKK